MPCRYIRPSPVDQTLACGETFPDPGVSDGHVMYRHGTASVVWRLRVGGGVRPPYPRPAESFGPSGEGGLSARPAFEDEAVQAEAGGWGRQPPGTMGVPPLWGYLPGP
ncbi:hypothetical protein C4B68_33260 [Streptomyces dengpaensis]|uniref:Uncharacterized protein n=1 Tax=Streptomyces dengpaensis TaxID=2049881 RepID=A0ABM6SZC8_9ACTN|nr:hypothetical protein C4B68_33260 [Streptomyces dengpaensis]